MQPCPVCGVATVDPAGYCTGCRTLRGAPAPASPRIRSPLLIPLIALSATLVVLVVAIVVVVVARSGDARRTGAAGAVVDSCVVGTWKVTAYHEDVPVNGVGTVRFTGAGFEVRLRADGSGVTDYHDSGTTFKAEINSIPYTLVVTGTVRFDFRADAGSVSFSHLRPTGKEKLTNDKTGQSETLDLQGSGEPASYTCAGNALIEFTGQYRAEMSRVSRKA
jgi:hypothetical protein